MKNRKLLISILAVFMALMMLLGVILSVIPPAHAVTSSEIQDQITAMEKEQAGLKAEIDRLESLKAENVTQMQEMIAQKDVLDQQISLLHEQVLNADRQIAAYVALIADKQKELEQAQARLDELNTKHKERIRAMEEDGSLSYWSVLFQANSFSDFLDRLNMIDEIAASDRRRLAELSEAAETVAAVQKELQEEKANLDANRAILVENEAQIQAKSAEVQQLLLDMKAKGDEFQAYLVEAEALADKLAEEIGGLKVEYDRVKYEEWLAAQRPASGWIVPCKYIRVSSPFGTRNDPFTGEPGKSHYGVDLAAPCTPIYATRSGVVVTNSYQAGGAGYYVAIDHTDGYRSTYMHMCKRSSVQTGQFVSAGEVIGCVGSTGASTGSHLHFEIRYDNNHDGFWSNAEALDPMQFIG